MFTAEELKRIEGAIAAAEKRTSGEIVTMVMPRSGDYRWVHCFWAGMGWAIGSGLIEIQSLRSGWPPTLAEMLLGQGAGAVLGVLFSLSPAIIRLTTPARWLTYQVYKESLALFVTQGLTQTRDRTGILIILSLLERRVQIIADSGIHKTVDEGYWKLHADNIVAGIRSGHAGPAVVAAIDAMGEKLAAHFPPRVDDQDELSNQVRLGRKPGEEL